MRNLKLRGFSTDIDECTSSTHRCQNDGTCVNIFGGYNCNCVTGFTGHLCEIGKPHFFFFFFFVKRKGPQATNIRTLQITVDNFITSMKLRSSKNMFRHR